MKRFLARLRKLQLWLNRRSWGKRVPIVRFGNWPYHVDYPKGESK